MSMRRQLLIQGAGSWHRVLNGGVSSFLGLGGLGGKRGQEGACASISPGIGANMCH